jgi:hypothetical protein
MVDARESKKAVQRARDDLDDAFAKWDENVAAMQLSWIAVRTALKRLHAAIMREILSPDETG